MNKLGMVLGLAAVATLAGCKDPDWKSDRVTPTQNEVKNVDTAPAEPEKTVAVEPPVKKCTCAPGTKHASPCKCGAPDCQCVVETKPVATADLTKPAEPEYTVYVVQNGDYLAKISKKYNVTINSIKRLNPSINGDVIRVGQKLKLPGKIDVGVQEEAPKAAVVKPTVSAKKGFVSYKGATKDYVVKNGDTLGAIAYGNGITIRQLKELNALSSDSLKIGQKLKIPAEKVAKAPAKTNANAAAVKSAPVKAETKAPVVAPVEEAAPAEEAPVAAPVEETAPAAAAPADAATAPTVAAEPAKPVAPATTTYVVQEGDDMTGVSIRWGVSAADIRELNNLAETDQLVPGQIIKLPADAQQ